jgi:hypothetical protein
MFTQRKLLATLAFAVLALSATASFADGNLREDSNQLENRAGALASRLKNDIGGNDQRVAWAQALAGQATHFHQLVKQDYQPTQLANEYYELENAYSNLNWYVQQWGLPRDRDYDKFNDMSRAFYKVYAYFH